MTAPQRPKSIGARPDSDDHQEPNESVSLSRDASTREAADSPPSDIVFGDLLELLGDEYACEILRALNDGPTPARELIEERGMSRPTVYRRLDRLSEAGIVESHMVPDPDGHHRQEFSLVVDEVEFRVGPDGIDGRVAGD